MKGNTDDTDETDVHGFDCVDKRLEDLETERMGEWEKGRNGERESKYSFAPLCETLAPLSTGTCPYGREINNRK